jgi:hypothetical protein
MAAEARRGKSYSFTLIPASLINFAHCGISDLIIAANSGGVLARSPAGAPTPNRPLAWLCKTNRRGPGGSWASVAVG